MLLSMRKSILCKHAIIIKTGVGHNMGHFEVTFFDLKIKSVITADCQQHIFSSRIVAQLIIYRHSPLLIIALISGLAWGIIFTKCPNTWGVALSHSLLGGLAMFLGVI